MLHQIGAGVLGPVFRAYQPAPGRLVAVKQFRIGLPPDQAQRFVAALDQIVAADLTHPGVAAPIAAGLTEATPFLALDFVAAESFDVVMREYGPAQVKDVLHVTRQLSGALDAAAVSGVVHGALHPRDVLMAADDVRMTGLGIAQALEGIGLAAPIRRPYAAPERTAGAPWDRRSDTYSLAALAYEMLAGRRVLAPGRASAENLPTIEGADIDRLRVVFATGLAETPSERFEHAREFADALERALTPSGRSRTSRRRRQAEPPLNAPQELPLEIELNAPPVAAQGEVHPVLEMAVLDAALPQAADAAHGEPELTLIEVGRGDLDLASLDTRLDALAAPPSPVERQAVEIALEPRSPLDADHADLQLHAVDAAAEQSAAGRASGARDVLEIDTDGIALTAEPLPQYDDVWPVEPQTAPAPSPGGSGAWPERESDPGPGSELERMRARDLEFETVPPLEVSPAPFTEVAAAQEAKRDELAWDEPRPDAESARTDEVAASEHGHVHRSERDDSAGHVGRSMPLEPGEASRSGNWPIVLGVVFGLLVGFAFGYGIGQSRLTGGSGTQATAAGDAASASPPSTTQIGASDASAGGAAPNSPPVSTGTVAPSAPSSAAATVAAAPAPATQPASSTPSPKAAAPVPTPSSRGSQAVVAPKPPAEQRLVVRTTPAGSRVIIDGKDAGLTPLTVVLPQGTHVVRLAHQGYVAAERRVRIGSQPAQPIDLELVARPSREVAASPATAARASGSLVLDSRPTGARVFVDEALVGTTPVTIDAIASGDHKVRFEMDGFGPWSTTAKVTAGGKTRVSGSLER